MEVSGSACIQRLKRFFTACRRTQNCQIRHRISELCEPDVVFLLVQQQLEQTEEPKNHQVFNSVTNSALRMALSVLQTCDFTGSGE